MTRRSLCFSTALLVIAAAPAAAQRTMGVLDVSVVEDSSGRPLSGVRVQLAGQNVAAYTGPGGVAVLRGVPPGPQLLQVNRIGYGPVSAPLQVAAGDSLPLEVALEPAAVRMAGVTATVRMRRALQSAGFYTRQRRGLGVFVGPEEMQQNERFPLHLSLGMLPGVRVTTTGSSGIPHYYLSSSRSAASSLRGTCIMNVYLDGVPVADPEIDDIPSQMILAAEVFRGPSEIPPQYNATGANTCGVVLLWTKDR